MRQRWARAHEGVDGQSLEGDMCSNNLGMMVGRWSRGFAEPNEPLNAEVQGILGDAHALVVSVGMLLRVSPRSELPGSGRIELCKIFAISPYAADVVSIGSNYKSMRPG